MRTEQIWDAWMDYDEEEFCYVLRDDAPDDVKAAYERHVEEMEKSKVNGCIVK